MSLEKKIKTALISVYHKDGLEEIIKRLNELNVRFISTGGTRDFIESFGIECTPVETLTNYPSILGGRVKTLHPQIFGGILARRDLVEDQKQIKAYGINEIDLVIVDLYPFTDTVASGGDEKEIIEKIDIGGISLIRAAAKNYKDVLVVASKKQYMQLFTLLTSNNGTSTIDDRKWFAKEAFGVSSAYDTAIFNYMDDNQGTAFRYAEDDMMPLRYGENPHQKGFFYGDFNSVFDQLHGKEISYNNLLDIDAAVSLISEFDETTVAILKHNNACGIASRNNVKDAWQDALAGDPVSAFGGIIITNEKIDKETAEAINTIFFEVIIAPSYDDEALEILKQKKNRIILLQKENIKGEKQFRSLLNGVLVQDKDLSIQSEKDLKLVTKRELQGSELEDLLFANKLVKHTKSNAIILVKNKQLCAGGTGQTSRVDALKQAIEKAKTFNFDLEGAVMASDAFFPFPDCVEIAGQAGITAVVQPGGSIKDDLSIEYCNNNNISMVMTGIRHFKH
ncbi:MAG: bifunctional phosphoribosylaminoimidazolecarboxamide formyltransferase/IMP cyclohydrolase [Dysgonomonas sp.]